MKLLLHKAWHNKLDPPLQVYIDILKFNNIDHEIVDSSDHDFWDKIQSCDYFIGKWDQTDKHHQLGPTLLPIIEKEYHKKVFPNINTYWTYDDKVKQFLLLKSHNLPAVTSWVFWEYNKAIQWINQHDKFPLVFKLKGGAGSMGVYLVKSKKEAKSFIDKSFKKGFHSNKRNLIGTIKILNYDPIKIVRHYGIRLRNKFIYPENIVFYNKQRGYVYFQEFLPDNTFDTRVTTAGLRAHAFRRFNRKNDFRASGSDNWDISPDKIDMRMVKIALDISKQFGFQSMAYDFGYDANMNPRIIEMSYLYGGAGIPDFMNGYWDENLNWIEGRFWPQHFELIDLLAMPDLKCPETLDINTTYKKVLKQ